MPVHDTAVVPTGGIRHARRFVRRDCRMYEDVVCHADRAINAELLVEVQVETSSDSAERVCLFVFVSLRRRFTRKSHGLSNDSVVSVHD